MDINKYHSAYHEYSQDSNPVNNEQEWRIIEKDFSSLFDDEYFEIPLSTRYSNEEVELLEMIGFPVEDHQNYDEADLDKILQIANLMDKIGNFNQEGHWTFDQEEYNNAELSGQDIITINNMFNTLQDLREKYPNDSSIRKFSTEGLKFYRDHIPTILFSGNYSDVGRRTESKSSFPIQ